MSTATRAFRFEMTATDPKWLQPWNSSHNGRFRCVRPITEQAMSAAYPKLIGVVTYSNEVNQTFPLARATICEQARADSRLAVSCGSNSLYAERLCSGAGKRGRAPRVC